MFSGALLSVLLAHRAATTGSSAGIGCSICEPHCPQDGDWVKSSGSCLAEVPCRTVHRTGCGAPALNLSLMLDFRTPAAWEFKRMCSSVVCAVYTHRNSRWTCRSVHFWLAQWILYIWLCECAFRILTPPNCPQGTNSFISCMSICVDVFFLGGPNHYVDFSLRSLMHLNVGVICSSYIRHIFLISVIGQRANCAYKDFVQTLWL